MPRLCGEQLRQSRGMHIALVDGHPDRDKQRFCHALAAAYAEGAKQSGHEVRLITIAD